MAKKDAANPFAAMLEGLTLEEMRELATKVLDLNAYDRRPRVEKRRRPRLRSAKTLTLRVDLVDAKPPIWRRVEEPTQLKVHPAICPLAAAPMARDPRLPSQPVCRLCAAWL